MSRREIARYATTRRQKVQQIVAEIHLYKACNQCRSILFKRARVCGVCGAYRFDEDPAALIATAKEMQRSPLPNQVDLVAFKVISTGDQSSAYKLGWQWLTGSSDKNRLFSGHDPVADEMRNSPEAEKSRQELREKLQAGCRPGMEVPFVRYLGAEPKGKFYAGFWQDLFGRNPTRAFLGSFTGKASVTKCIGCCAVVTFDLHDPATWSSATRFPPPYGYDQNRKTLFDRPWTPIVFGAEWIGDIATFRINADHIPSSIFYDNYFGKYGQNIDVHITWEEIICPQGLAK